MIMFSAFFVFVRGLSADNQESRDRNAFICTAADQTDRLTAPLRSIRGCNRRSHMLSLVHTQTNLTRDAERRADKMLIYRPMF